MMPRAIGTLSYPSFPAPSIRRSRASIASHTNTNSRTTSTLRGHCGRWSSCASAGGRCWWSSTPEASPSIALSASPWRSDDFSARSGAVCRTWPAPRTWAHSQGHQASQRARGFRDRASVAYRLWHRLTPAARAPGARTSRDHRRHAGLHGAGADGTDEPLRRCAQRSLCVGCDPLPDGHRRAAVCSRGSHGAGALPYRAPGRATRRTDSRRACSNLGCHHEVARQDAGGSISNRRRCGRRPATLPDAVSAGRQHRAFCSGGARHP